MQLALAGERERGDYSQLDTGKAFSAASAAAAAISVRSGDLNLGFVLKKQRRIRFPAGAS